MFYYANVQFVTPIQPISFRMCKLHFTPSDFQLETSHFDERSGRKLTTKYEIPKLNNEAVPSKLSNCPDSRRKGLEEIALGNAISQALFMKKDSGHQELEFLDISYWSVVQ